MRFHRNAGPLYGLSGNESRSLGSGKVGARLPTRVEQAADSGNPRIYPDTDPTKVNTQLGLFYESEDRNYSPVLLRKSNTTTTQQYKHGTHVARCRWLLLNRVPETALFRLTD